MEKTPNYIKKTLDEVKVELLKDKKLQLSRKLYVQKLKEIFSKQVIDLKDGVQAKLSSTGTNESVVLSSSDTTSVKKTPIRNSNKNNKVIFLNNEIIDQNLNDIEEANNELFNMNENVIELKDEIQSNDQKIIELIEEVDEIINLTEEVADTVTASTDIANDETLNTEEIPSDVSNENNDFTDLEEDFENIDTHEADPDSEEMPLNEELETTNNDATYVNDALAEDTLEKVSLSNEQIDLLSAKINDLDLNSSELTEKLDELLNQKNLFSEKFNDELDIKLTEALNRSEENLEGKINNINDTYHQEFSKYEDEASKNFANLEDQIGQLNLQLDKITDLQDYNLKIENSLNNLNNKIEETLDKISLYKNETDEKFNQIHQKIDNMEPELVNKIVEKERNKSESEKLQDKFDQMSKIMDMQNMRMLQMYHSSELQHSHSILQKNMESGKGKPEQKINPEFISEELKKEVFPKIQKEMDKQFNLLKEQLSEYEIKSVLDKIGSTDLNKEFKKPTKKFSNFFDAKKYVKNSISKKSRDWIKNNDIAIDEIAKKLLDK
ncbi:hypothetical protein [Candidatus Pelagibacter sp.]|uniref:hypothetical protein n=1 Tax=Candidatus Pelagibacter sp. TaxID=2024849 RepID=UPI003F868E47